MAPSNGHILLASTQNDGRGRSHPHRAGSCSAYPLFFPLANSTSFCLEEGAPAKALSQGGLHSYYRDLEKQFGPKSEVTLQS